MTYNISHSTDYRPLIHDALPSSNNSARLNSAVIEPSNHLPRHYLSLMLLHLETHAQYHEHVVHSVDAHRVDITQSVATGYPSLHVGVVHKRVKEVCRGYQVLCRVMQVFGHAAIRGLLSDGAIPDIFQVTKESRGRNFATSSLERGERD